MSIKKELKEIILEVLIKKQELTAKQIYFAIKNLGKSYTYQAVCKSLKNLIETKTLKKEEGRFYKISENWVWALERFIEEFYKLNTTKKEPINIIEKKNKITDKRIKVIAFELDGCLSDKHFDHQFWDVEVPKLVAKERKLSFDQAYKYTANEYRKMWGKTNEWRDPEFWLKHLGITEPWQEVVSRLKKQIKHYGDTIPTIKNLKNDYTLIIIAHAARKFLDLKLGINKLGDYFDYTFSTPNDFGSMSRTEDIYLKICQILKIKPGEMVYLGDSYELDYTLPISLGIRGFLIKRSGEIKADYVVKDLYEFEEKIRRLG